MAFLLISSGIFGYPKDQALRVAVDTIGGFNSIIEKQKKEASKALISTVMFDNESVVIHYSLPLDAVPRMTEKEYFT